MSRYNLFHKIHKGLRALLYDTSILLQRTDFTIEDEAKEAITRLKFVVILFEKYQESEDIYVLPAINAYEPGVADSFEQDHEEAYLMGRKIENQVKDFCAAKLPLEQLSVSEELVSLFEEFTLFNILHMGKEEQVVNKMLWRYYTDAELQKIAWKIVNVVEPSYQMPYSKWMIQGLNNSEIVRWFKEIKYTAPEVEFQSILKTAEAELHPRRWNLLQDVLVAGALVAN